MPSTDEDEALIASMPTGTRVAHWKFGVGVVDGAPEYMQVPVRFATPPDGQDRLTVFCYPSNLEILVTGPVSPPGDLTLYRASDGTEIQIVTPWNPDGSGIIPPPVVSFYRDGRTWDFYYADR